MKPLYILKIGGSVATHKTKKIFSPRKALLKKIAMQIKLARKKGAFDLILIHGAGGYSHALAREYGLKEGTKNDPRKIHGALLSRAANQKLDLAILEILIEAGLHVVPVHTASVVVHDRHQISDFDLTAIKEALKSGYVPMLYGDMVFDKTLGMSVCSGDAIAPYLTSKLHGEKIFFATDVEGVFNKDPYLNKDAELIENIDFSQIEKNVQKSESHNIDVTGGLYGKIQKINLLGEKKVSSVEIFNGLEENNYQKALLGKRFKHTKITF